ncbi:MAG: sigma-70 family RNA polymerase sigma factor [Pirellulales bacterium]|nr:sigma-70 family RNA polymerase sigma factor [Pirellulales bacterium]
MDPRHNNNPGEEFARLFARHQRRVYSYIFSLLGDWAAAEDVFQDTCVVMWTKFADFQPGSDFAGWACRIARFKVLKYRRQCKRRLPFVGEQFIETVAAARESEKGDLNDWTAVLTDCIEKLTPKDRRLIVKRYSEDCTIKELAEKLGLPSNTVYKAIGRIRKGLLDCVEKATAREEHP